MSLVRPAAGGESCKAGFFLVEYSGRPAKKQRRFKAVNVTEEQKRKGSRDDSADRLRCRKYQKCGKSTAEAGQETILTRDRERLLEADKVILPGVGSFGDAMENLKNFGLIPVIHEIVERKTPFLGICLGLQLLFERSEESPGVEGLGILPGEILRIPRAEGLKIPHMGWNSLKLTGNGRLFQGIEEDPYVYFVHSYYLKAADPGIVKAVTEYGVEIHASVEKDHVFACQFHPEKSSETGLAILKNFAEI